MGGLGKYVTCHICQFLTFLFLFFCFLLGLHFTILVYFIRISVLRKMTLNISKVFFSQSQSSYGTTMSSVYEYQIIHFRNQAPTPAYTTIVFRQAEPKLSVQDLWKLKRTSTAQVDTVMLRLEMTAMWIQMRSPWQPAPVHYSMRLTTKLVNDSASLLAITSILSYFSVLTLALCARPSWLPVSF